MTPRQSSASRAARRTHRHLVLASAAALVCIGSFPLAAGPADAQLSADTAARAVAAAKAQPPAPAVTPGIPAEQHQQAPQSDQHPDNAWMNAFFIDGTVEGARPDPKKQEHWGTRPTTPNTAKPEAGAVPTTENVQPDDPAKPMAEKAQQSPQDPSNQWMNALFIDGHPEGSKKMWICCDTCKITTDRDGNSTLHEPDCAVYLAAVARGDATVKAKAAAPQAAPKAE